MSRGHPHIVFVNLQKCLPVFLKFSALPSHWNDDLGAAKHFLKTRCTVKTICLLYCVDSQSATILKTSYPHLLFNQLPKGVLCFFVVFYFTPSVQALCAWSTPCFLFLVSFLGISTAPYTGLARLQHFSGWFLWFLCRWRHVNKWFSVYEGICKNNKNIVLENLHVCVDKASLWSILILVYLNVCRGNTKT